MRLNLTQLKKTYNNFYIFDNQTKDFIGFVLSGAWPFLVGGLTCLVDSGNERDPIFKLINYFNKLFLKDNIRNDKEVGQ